MTILKMTQEMFDAMLEHPALIEAATRLQTGINDGCITIDRDKGIVTISDTSLAGKCVTIDYTTTTKPKQKKRAQWKNERGPGRFRR